MRRRSAFDRDFADLHGDDAQDFIRHEHVRGGRVAELDHPGFRLGLAAIGLFWVIVLGAALLAGVAAVLAFVASLLGL